MLGYCAFPGLALLSDPAEAADLESRPDWRRGWPPELPLRSRFDAVTVVARLKSCL